MSRVACPVCGEIIDELILRNRLMPNDCVTARKRVMIIAHGRRLRLELADWLASDGYEVAIVRQADMAVEQLSTMRPDRIVWTVTCRLRMD